MGKWPELSIAETAEALKSDCAEGLREEEATKRLEKYGLNEIGEKKDFTAIRLFAAQFRSFMVAILLVALVVSAIIGDIVDAAVIFAVLVIIAVLGFAQEFKAEKAMAALKRISVLEATVIREGRPKRIDSKLLVPGDLILIKPGDKLPADLRLIEGIELSIDEAMLTGESRPAGKHPERLSGKVQIAEQKNMAFMNTIAVCGHGKGIVVATGMQTEFGKLAGLMQTISEEESPLKKRVEYLAKQLGTAIVLICILLFALMFVAAGAITAESFMLPISLMVAAIPEGLPAVITIALALGVQRMAGHKAIVRRMPAVETLGSAAVICTDKTGTITRNEMSVRKLYVDSRMVDVSGAGYAPFGNFSCKGKTLEIADEKALSLLLDISASCNDAEVFEENSAWKIAGDPTEGALAVLALKANMRKKDRFSEIAFSSERKMMSTLHKISDNKFAYSKGAVEKLLQVCGRTIENGKIKALTAEKKRKILEVEAGLASGAYRVLGFAYKKLPSSNEEIERDLVFVGLAAMYDPPRKEAGEAIRLCRSAGIKVKMLTGDSKLTACAIAREIGLKDYSKALTGAELDGLSEEGFAAAAIETSVFARISPEHKLRIVEALKNAGEIVAVTGDGINDAPALKKADMGIAMGIKGTDVAKEASDMILQDDNFATIVNAVAEGRRIYANIRNFIKYLLSANFGELAAITIAAIVNLALFDFPLPLIPVQILWINLLTDALPALALSREDGESGIMLQKPRDPKEHILKGNVLFICIAAALATIATLAAFAYGYGFGMGGDLTKGRAMAFTTIVLFELVLVFNCRAEGKTVFEMPLFSNKYLIAAVVSSLALQLVVIYSAWLQPLFGTVALGFADWGMIIALSAGALLVPYVDRALKPLIRKLI